VMLVVVEENPKFPTTPNGGMLPFVDKSVDVKSILFPSSRDVGTPA
jgi:hypothetical protein